jgi:hypothetical protein
MQDERYIVAQIDGDGSYYETEPLDAMEAAELIAIDHMLHQATGWAIERCSCGLGFAARKNSHTRFFHISVFDNPEDDLVSLALAVGVLAPASRKDRLEVVL